ncbi:nucleoside triphosphate pyrophosphohydrolase [Coralliovum pocilloporae]|uniref:nucleoside triphosphate pyrophosphohydrolase n=1 Tax=Coralliovum pocilloporae TaxID=3066369 RepID=UPI003307977D
MKPSRDIARLLEIMKALRTPVTGCPWDLEQTFETIAPYTIEEAYEVADAIQRDDLIDLEDELGDLLLQVVYHAQMAEEQGQFDFGDVVMAITKKMIRRHPHVFENERSDIKGIKTRWEDIKAIEKQEKQQRKNQINKPEENAEVKGLLEDIPNNFPANMEAQKLQKRAGTVGFDWNDLSLVLDKMEEEIAEIREALTTTPETVKEEVGDLMFCAVNVARHAGVEAEDALRGCNNKFRKRFNYIERNINSINDATLEEMEDLWKNSKNQ